MVEPIKKGNVTKCPTGFTLVNGKCQKVDVEALRALPPIDPKSAAGGKPVIFKGDVPVPKREAAPKLLSLAERQAEERRLKDIPKPLEVIQADPTQFGLQAPTQQPTQQPTQPRSEIDQVTGEPLLTGGVSSAQGLVEGLAGGGLVKGGVALAAPILFKVGNKLLGGKAAVQAGTAAKNSASATEQLAKLKIFGIKAGGVIGTGVGILSWFNRKLPEQQQAVNTLGQITSSIVGDSTTSRGDFRKGLTQLRFIKQEILRLESDIKGGTLKEAQLKFNGEIIDINADIFDQLATIDEGIRDIQSFALDRSFPELNELELQILLRQLEEEGFIEPIDLTTSFRPTSQRDLRGSR